MGTFHAASGTWTPASEDGTSCSLGVAYNNSALSGGSFYHNISGGNSVLDEGRIPSTSSGGPADSYEMHGVSLAYSTNQPTVDVQLTFWNQGAVCQTLAELGTPTAQVMLSGLPGSASGNLESVLIDVDLSGGNEFTMLADGNGSSAGQDRFMWAFKVLNQASVPGALTGPLTAATPNTCASGAGIFGDTLGCDGLGGGSGLGTQDQFRRAIDGTQSAGCFWFGGFPQFPFASFYLKLNTSNVNDACTGALPLGSAVGPNLASFDNCCATTGVMQPSNCAVTTIFRDVWYSWTAPTTDVYFIDTCGSAYDTKLNAWRGADCALATCDDYDDDGCGFVQSQVVVSATAGESFLFQVGAYGSACGSGTLNITDSTQVSDPMGEDDSCLEAATLAGGSQAGLVVQGDEDWFQLIVCPGDTLDVFVGFDDVHGNLDAELLDLTLGCVGAPLLDSGTSNSPNEHLVWTNNGTQPRRVALRLHLSAGLAAEYLLHVIEECRLGERYCSVGVQHPNSSGRVARLSLAGSDEAGSNRLHLFASDLPAAEFGYFLWSPSAAQIDLPAQGISDGLLCLGPGAGRFNGAAGGQGGVLATGASGLFQLTFVDTSALPTSTGAPLAVTAGTSGHFQAWYRDGAGVNGNHFTDAVRLTWQ